MFEQAYRRFFDSISPSAELKQRTERKVMEMLDPKNRRRKNVRRTLIVALAVLMITGAALAAATASGILTRLFPGGEPSSRAVDALVKDAVEVSHNGVKLHMDEYLFDHNTLHLGWTVSSTRKSDIFYTTSYDIVCQDPADEAAAQQSAGFGYGGYSSGEVGDGVLVRLSPKMPSFSGNAGFGYKAAPDGPVKARVVVRAYETDYSIENVESVEDLYALDQTDNRLAALEEAGKIGLSPEQMTRVSDYSAFIQARDKLTQDGMEWDEACEAALTKSGIFREVAVLEMTVDVDPNQAALPRFQLDGEQVFELPGRTVALKTLSIDTASTLIEYEVTTSQAFDETETVGAGVAYLLLDQAGNVLNVDYILGMAGDYNQALEGKYVHKIVLNGNPLPETVTAITFAPMVNMQREAGESANAFYLRMAESARPEDCFTVKLDGSANG